MNAVCFVCFQLEFDVFNLLVLHVCNECAKNPLQLNLFLGFRRFFNLLVIF